MTMTPELASKRPTLEQIDRIRQLSTVVFDSAGQAFDAFGYPSTRGEAGALIKRLDGMRTHENEAFVEEVDEKTCGMCEETKPADAFGTHKGTRDGLHRYCKDCLNRKVRERHADKEEDPMADGDTMHCGRCNTDKPKSDFSPSVQAKGNGWCRACFRDYSREKAKADRMGGRVEPSKADKKRSKAKSSTSKSGTQGRAVITTSPVITTSIPPGAHEFETNNDGSVVVDPPPSALSNLSALDWRSQLVDPKLSKLTALQEALGIPTLEETAAVVRLIAGGVLT